MKNFKTDSRIVLTLDAGGTNMVFGAMKAGEYVGEPITLPSNSTELDKCMSTMETGFKTVIDGLGEKPAAISFAFPGPADYPKGIIGGYLPNFPSFRDGVALGPFLEDKFGVPVFINNDGDLYAYGEAMGGALPEINGRLAAAGSSKRYKNLIGYTLGTGFGVGIVINGSLNLGDNSCVETFCLPNPELPGYIIEDSVAIRAIKRVYGKLSGNPDHGLEPKEIGAICTGSRPGNRKAAIAAFNELGEAAGEAMAIAATLVDGLIVIGGGIMNNYKFIMPGILKTMRGKIKTMSGDTINRVQSSVYNLDEPEEFDRFAKGNARKLKVYGSEREVIYDPQKRIGVMRSKIGASKAISVGAYIFALSKLDNE
ncbi:MAG: ROK family protein [Bacteroidales bacterium]|jgi:predicted NBD/HSP70 family sugar kinase|nr:ROK family protein [Bacteroidales bacterium]MCI1784659.1 ROK family protein [Bacteroidales bacterium]